MTAGPSASGSQAIPTTFVTRIGLALVRPQWALAIAGGRRYPGRSGSDLIAMLMLLLLATQLRTLVGSLWLGVVVDLGLGLRAAAQIVTRTVTVDLAFLVIGALLLFVVAGKRRDLGRAFDLACVAVLPLVFVDLAAAIVVRNFDIHVPVAIAWGIAGVAWAWTGALLAMSARIVRVPPSATPAPHQHGDGMQLGKKPGWGVMAVIAIGVALQGVWIVRNLDLMRPVSHGDPAPEVALPAIVDARGTLGPVQTLSQRRGKIVVVDFWATWCKPCIESLPTLEQLARQPDVEVLAINLDAPGRAFAMFQNAKFRMTLVADDGEVSERYGVSTIPHTVVVDRDGIVRGVYRGGHDIAARVEQIRK